jgi:hypothetical protein
MHLKRKGTVLISSVVILALMSILGCFIFNMMRNNMEISSLYNFDKDRYDLDKKEEEILKRFMTKINIEFKNMNNVDKLSEKNIFSEDFKKYIEDSTLEYHKTDNKLILKTHKDNKIIRNREINYLQPKDKIILIPTYKFEDENE